jgi:hypothetical protein
LLTHSKWFQRIVSLALFAGGLETGFVAGLAFHLAFKDVSTTALNVTLFFVIAAAYWWVAYLWSQRADIRTSSAPSGLNRLVVFMLAIAGATMALISGVFMYADSRPRAVNTMWGTALFLASLALLNGVVAFVLQKKDQ